jgi:hypothetical protein
MRKLVVTAVCFQLVGIGLTALLLFTSPGMDLETPAAPLQSHSFRGDVDRTQVAEMRAQSKVRWGVLTMLCFSVVLDLAFLIGTRGSSPQPRKGSG